MPNEDTTQAQTEPEITVAVAGLDTSALDQAYNDLQDAIKAGDDAKGTAAISAIDDVVDGWLGEPEDTEDDQEDPEDMMNASGQDPFAAKVAQYAAKK